MSKENLYVVKVRDNLNAETETAVAKADSAFTAIIAAGYGDILSDKPITNILNYHTEPENDCETEGLELELRGGEITIVAETTGKNSLIVKPMTPVEPWNKPLKTCECEGTKEMLDKVMEDRQACKQKLYGENEIEELIKLLNFKLGYYLLRSANHAKAVDHLLRVIGKLAKYGFTARQYTNDGPVSHDSKTGTVTVVMYAKNKERTFSHVEIICTPSINHIHIYFTLCDMVVYSMDLDSEKMEYSDHFIGSPLALDTGHTNFMYDVLNVLEPNEGWLHVDSLYPSMDDEESTDAETDQNEGSAVEKRTYRHKIVIKFDTEETVNVGNNEEIDLNQAIDPRVFDELQERRIKLAEVFGVDPEALTFKETTKVKK